MLKGVLNKHIFGTTSSIRFLPRGFHSAKESEWQFSDRFGTFAEGVKLLIDAGFEQIDNPWK